MPKKNTNALGNLIIGGAALSAVYVLGRVTTSQPTHSSPSDASPTTYQPVEREVTRPTPFPQTQFPSTPTAPPTTSATPRVRSAAEIARIQKYIPPEVTLTADVAFPVVSQGQVVGVGTVPRSSTATVVKVTGDKLLLDYEGRKQSVPIAWTDFLDRVIAEAER